MQMKAIIRIDVPEHQIGQEVSCYFKDTMNVYGVCEAERTGHWTAEWFDAEGEERHYCSECGKWEYTESDFCPNCGARMDGDAE